MAGSHWRGMAEPTASPGSEDYPADRTTPVELRLSGDRATVIARGKGCVAKSFVLDHGSGSISPVGEEGC
jgi:hypothetical protein